MDLLSVGSSCMAMSARDIRRSCSHFRLSSLSAYSKPNLWARDLSVRLLLMNPNRFSATYRHPTAEYHCRGQSRERSTMPFSKSKSNSTQLIEDWQLTYDEKAPHNIHPELKLGMDIRCH